MLRCDVSSLQWFFTVLLVARMFSLLYYISALEKTANQAVWRVVDAMANCRKEFNEYADAWEQLSGFRCGGREYASRP